MKKHVGWVALLLVAGTVQADTVQWASYLLGGDGTTWVSAINWYNYYTGNNGVPSAIDHVIIDEQGLGYAIPTMPTLGAAAGPVGVLSLGWAYAGMSRLDITTGGSLAAVYYARVGNVAGSMAVLGMDGGFLSTPVLQVGFNDVAENAGGSGVVNLSGSAILEVGGVGFGQELPDYAVGTAQAGTGEIKMADHAMVLYAGDQTGGRAQTMISSGWISPVNAGDAIAYRYDGLNDRTVFTVVPEPGTVGMILQGMGILWLRKRRRSTKSSSGLDECKFPDMQMDCFD